MKKVDVSNNVSEEVAGALGRFYDRMLINALKHDPLEIFEGEIIGWEKKKVKRYLHIPVPFFEKHYDYSGFDRYFEGILFGIRMVKTPIFVGYQTICVPIRKKPEGKKIKFRRYSKLSTK